MAVRGCRFYVIALVILTILVGGYLVFMFTGGPEVVGNLIDRAKAQPTPEVIEKEVEVIKEAEVEVEVEKIVEVPVEVVKIVTDTVEIEVSKVITVEVPSALGAAESPTPEPEKVDNNPYFEVWINDPVCADFDAQPEGVKLGKGGGTVHTMGDGKGSANSNDWEDSLCVRGTTKWGVGTFALKFHVRDVEFSIDFTNPVEVRVREVGTTLSDQPLTKLTPTPAPEAKVEESPVAVAAAASAPTATPEPAAAEVPTITAADLPYNFEMGGDRAKFVSDTEIHQVLIVGKADDGKNGDGSDSFYQIDEAGNHVGEALMGGGAAGRWIKLNQPGKEFYLEARELPGAILADVK